MPFCSALFSRSTRPAHPPGNQTAFDRARTCSSCGRTRVWRHLSFVQVLKLAESKQMMPEDVVQ
eukprot:3939494-Pleurochrysis_carterae.AAC.1